MKIYKLSNMSLFSYDNDLYFKSIDNAKNELMNNLNQLLSQYSDHIAPISIFNSYVQELNKDKDMKIIYNNYPILIHKERKSIYGTILTYENDDVNILGYTINEEKLN